MDSILCKRNEIRLHVKCLRLRAKCFTLGNGSLKETEKNGSYMSWIQFVNLFCYEKSRGNILYHAIPLQTCEAVTSHKENKPILNEKDTRSYFYEENSRKIFKLN